MPVGQAITLVPGRTPIWRRIDLSCFFLLYTLGYREDFIGRLLLDGVRS